MPSATDAYLSSPPLPAAHELTAISLDLDDTLWPVLPTLIHAEKTLTAWLEDHAPATAKMLTPQIRAQYRNAVVARHPDRVHDMSFIRHQLLRDALSAAGDDPVHADVAFEIFLAARQQVSLFDDVRPVLERWQARYKLIAISNGNADLDRIGLGHWFEVKLSAHQVGMAKPDPRIFQLACERAGVEPAQVLHIGDNHKDDCVAARQVGLKAAWVRRPELATQAPASDHGVSGLLPGPLPERAFTGLNQIDLALHSSI